MVSFPCFHLFNDITKPIRANIGIATPIPIHVHAGSPKGPVGISGCVINHAVIGKPMAAAIKAIAVIIDMVITMNPLGSEKSIKISDGVV